MIPVSLTHFYFKVALVSERYKKVKCNRLCLWRSQGTSLLQGRSCFRKIQKVKCNRLSLWRSQGIFPLCLLHSRFALSNSFGPFFHLILLSLSLNSSVTCPPFFYVILCCFLLPWSSVVYSDMYVPYMYICIPYTCTIIRPFPYS